VNWRRFVNWLLRRPASRPRRGEARVSILFNGAEAVARDDVPDAEKSVEYLTSKLDEWCTIVGAIHRGHEAAMRERAASAADQANSPSLE
jgi:hypothetical protein